MTDLFTTPIDAITADDVRALLEHGPAEGPTVEYKAGLARNREGPDQWMNGGTRIGRDAQKKLTKEVVAFANTGGGTLILGIDETADDPPRPSKICPLPRCASLASHLTDVLKSAIDPALPFVHLQPVSIDGDAGVVVIRVPASRRAPHRCTHTLQAFKRFLDQSTPVDMREIHELVLQTRSGLEAIDSGFADASREAKTFLNESTLENGPSWGLSVAILPLRPFALPRLNSDIESARRLHDIPLILTGSERTERRAHFFDLSGPRRRTVRGVRYESYNRMDGYRASVYQDGRVQFCISQCARQGFGSRDAGFFMVPEWMFAVIINAILAAHQIRCLAGEPEAEMAIEIQFAVSNDSVQKRITTWSGLVFDGFSKYADVAAFPALPRYSLGPINELSQLLTLIHIDYWDGLGRDNDRHIDVEVGWLLQMVGLEAE